MGIQSDIRDHLLSQPASFKKKKEYHIEEMLGRGGFGKVLKATWKPAGGEKKEVALKWVARICYSLAWQQPGKRRLIRGRIISKANVRDNDTVKDEIAVLKDLDHPNIVHVWDHFESRDK
jgi:calcium/calmodulin-dependent protein kinase I